jgi:hypothetical protein
MLTGALQREIAIAKELSGAASSALKYRQRPLLSGRYGDRDGKCFIFMGERNTTLSRVSIIFHFL